MKTMDSIEPTKTNCKVEKNAAEQKQETTHASRIRSQSDATSQLSVETVVTKSKRAASTLWLLLHAQNCVVGNSCPSSGCQEAKRLHLHLKTCPASASTKNEACHSHYNGCEQARQLLNHYRRCRGERARQACRKESQQCLICSLVARQAKSMLGKVGQSRLSRSMITVINKDLSLGDAATGPSTVHMPPPPPRRGILSNSQRVADASILDARQNKTISFALDSTTRPRSSSVVENSSKGILLKGRLRSLSVGSSPTLPSPTCETILEEEGSSSTDHQLEDYPSVL